MGNPTEIAAKLSTDDRVVSVSYDFGNDLREATEKFSAAVVLSKFVQQCIIDVQAIVRKGLKAGTSDGEIAKSVAAYVPGVKVTSKRSPKEKAFTALEALTDEDRKELLRKFKISK